MTEMRVITVRQPWAWAIIHGGKDVENRMRNIAGSYRGPVAIHAGLAYDSAWSSRALDDSMRDSGEQMRPRPSLAAWRRNGGTIIGVVDLVGAHEGHNTERDRMRAVRSCFRPGKPYGACSKWAEPDVWHLELANPRSLAQPIPFRGALGLRRLDDVTRVLVEAGVAR